MLAPSDARLRHGFAIATAIAATLLAPQTVASEIFKCVAKDGSPLYQNFPCDIDSMGFLPSASPSPRPVPTVAHDPSKTAPGKPAVPAKSTEPSIGMSSDDVRTLLGEPQEMIEDEPASGGRVSTWRYSDGRSIQFDHKHRVLSVQR